MPSMNAVTRWIDFLFTRRRWVLHLAFWFLILAFYIIFFGRRNSSYWQTAFFVALLMPVTIGTTYFLNYYLVPQYVLKGRYLRFAIYTVYTILCSLLLSMLVALVTFVVMAGLRTDNMSPPSFDIVFLLTSLLVVAFLGVAIKMVLHWRQSREDYQRLMREKVEAELKFLKTQLNPHFLFNTLNNLYFLASEKSDKAPLAIMALSEILDYVMNAGRSLLVPLDKEWRQVENYISLELLRYEDRVAIKKDLSLAVEMHRVPPMIFMTLVENAFKHGVMQAAGASWIELSLSESEGNVNFIIRNSRRPAEPGTGIGLDNLRSQLHHLYGERFSLEVVNEPSVFSVHLILMSPNEI